MIITNKVTMDLIQRNWQPPINVVQNDQYTRNLEMQLFSNDSVWKIPDTASILIRYCKSDGTGGEYDTLPNGVKAWTAAENILTIVLAPQVLTVPGFVNLCVILIDDEKTLSTFSLLLNVQALPGALNPDSENYVRTTAFLPAPEGGQVGNLLSIASVDAAGNITGVEAIDFSRTESDPTVSDWAKQPHPPAYTAQDVGALPADTPIPTKTSDLSNDSGFLDSAALPAIVEDALMQAKASGIFDGTDGVSPTVSVSKSGNVTTIAIADVRGTKTATIYDGANGAAGKDGSNGADGKTPVRGVDYWTDADQEAIVQDVITALGTPVFGTVDADNTITLTGNLADGTYILKYEDAEGNQTEIGTIELGGGYTNQLPVSTDKDGNVYNGTGYKANTRYSSSSGADISHDGCYITGYIPVTAGAVIRIANMTMDKNISDGNKCFAYLFDTGKANGKKIQIGTGGAYTFDGLQAVWNSSGHLTQFTVPSDGFVRLQASYIGVDSIVTVNEEIV